MEISIPMSKLSKEEQRKRKTDRQREHRKNNPGLTSIREKRRTKYKLDRYHNKRKEAICFLGGKCTFCNSSNYYFLNIDHINGGGGKERKERTGGSNKFFKEILDGQRKDLRILCMECNIRAYRYGNEIYTWPEKIKKQLEVEIEFNINRNLYIEENKINRGYTENASIAKNKRPNIA